MMEIDPGIRKEIDKYLNHFKKDIVVQEWLKSAMKKPDKFKDRDLEFYTVVSKVIEDFAKLLVLTHFQKSSKISAAYNQLKTKEESITNTVINQLREEIINGRKSAKK